VVATRLTPVEIAVSAWGESWTIADPRTVTGTSAAAASGELRAPMAGKVVAVHTSPGQTVAAGELLFVVESMKMQLELRAPTSGTITEVRVASGDILAGPDVLAILR
jgi:biotin carboxyl carrier protein